MTADQVAGTVRGLCAGFHSEAAALAADGLNAMQAAHDALVPVSDHRNSAGRAAALALQILADAIASAQPPEAIRHD